jgi:hypothetical protein
MVAPRLPSTLIIMLPRNLQPKAGTLLKLTTTLGREAATDLLLTIF